MLNSLRIRESRASPRQYSFAEIHISSVRASRDSFDGLKDYSTIIWPRRLNVYRARYLPAAILTDSETKLLGDPREVECENPWSHESLGVEIPNVRHEERVGPFSLTLDSRHKWNLQQLHVQ